MGENKDYITYPDEKGNINIAEEVVAVIAANAAADTEGVAALSNIPGKEIQDLWGKKGGAKGVRLVNDENGLTVDVYLLVAMGVSVNKVGTAVQQNVTTAVESTTGITVREVNVHIGGVQLD